MGGSAGGSAGGGASGTAGRSTGGKAGRKAKPGLDHGQNKLTVGQRLQIVRAVQGSQQRSKVARDFGVGKAYITKLMKPKMIASLEKSRDMELNMDAKRTPTPVHADLQARLNQWIKIARQRFEVRIKRRPYQSRLMFFTSLAASFPVCQTVVYVVYVMTCCSR